MRAFYKLVWIQNSAHWSRLLCNCQLFFEEVKMRNLLRRNRTVWVNSMKLCRQPPGQPQPTMFVHNVRLEVEKVLCCACESGGCGHTNWFFYICTRPWMCKEWDPQYENLINKTTAPTTDQHGWLLFGWLLPSPAHCAWGPVGDWCRNPDAGTQRQMGVPQDLLLLLLRQTDVDEVFGITFLKNLFSCRKGSSGSKLLNGEMRRWTVGRKPIGIWTVSIDMIGQHL